MNFFVGLIDFWFYQIISLFVINYYSFYEITTLFMKKELKIIISLYENKKEHLKKIKK